MDDAEKRLIAFAITVALQLIRDPKDDEAVKKILLKVRDGISLAFPGE